MPSTDDRLDIVPRTEAGAWRSFSFALVVHLLLAAALTWGVNWTSSDPNVAFQAELWSNLQQEAAPALEASPVPLPVSPPVPPTPEPEPVPVPTPAPQPQPPAKVEAAPDPEIALEREKKRKKKEAEDKKTALALIEKADKAAKDKADKAEKILKEKELAKAKAKAKAAAQAKLEAQKLEAHKEQEAKKQAAADAKFTKENIARSVALAGATGGPEAKGSALQSSGPSTGYKGILNAKLRPNVSFTGDTTSNPVAEVEVRATIDGTITSQRLVKSSGNKAWDDAVIRAIIRMATLPRDVDGRMHTFILIEQSP